jgi:hypothetical protein
MHPCAEPFEILAADAIHDRLGENAPRGVVIA